MERDQQHRAPSSGTKTVAVVCNNNCGGRCQLKAHIENGVITRISTDDSPDTHGRHQLRACLKGRALRSRLRNPARLRYPMKRVGQRGEGNFQRISWDEAVASIAAKLKHAVERYGPASVYLQYATGDCGLVTGHAAAQRMPILRNDLRVGMLLIYAIPRIIPVSGSGNRSTRLLGASGIPQLSSRSS